VTDDLHGLRFNTAIAACMELVNSLNKHKAVVSMSDHSDVWKSQLTILVQMLAPFAPHISEELWHELGHQDSVHVAGWPEWDEALVVEETIAIVVQVNGKVRATVVVPRDCAADEIEKLARKDGNVERFLAGETVVKTIRVPGRLINFVTKN
jgi:leucyl-tRNA synthetase